MDEVDVPSEAASVDLVADKGWSSLLNFDFNCSDELYESTREISDTELSLRELVLKRVYERERAFRLREQALLQRLEDMEAKLLILEKNSIPITQDSACTPVRVELKAKAESDENTRPMHSSASKRKADVDSQRVLTFLGTNKINTLH